MLFLFLLSSSVSSREVLTLGVLGADANGRYAYDWLTRQFEQNHPGIKVKTLAFADAQFKRELKVWLETKTGPDLLTWQGGERLYGLVRQDLVMPLDDFWQTNRLDYQFDKKSIESISVDGKKYGIPLSYYNWGFYYRKSLFDDLDIDAPKNWQELLHVCKTLKKGGILPIAIGTKTPWTASAWFSYITLRLYGMEFYNSLISGGVSFTDMKVLKVFQMWKTLLDTGCFPADHQQYEWNEIMPSLFRKIAGMTLIGSFFTASVPESLADDFAYFTFPNISPDVPRYELAPLDLMMIPSYSSKQELAKKFLLFLSRGDIQAQLNEKLQMLPANVNAHIRGDYFTKVGLTSLLNAEGTTQFLDRDTADKTAKSVLPILSKFMHHKDINRTIEQLEEARIKGMFSYD